MEKLYQLKNNLKCFKNILILFCQYINCCSWYIRAQYRTHNTLGVCTLIFPSSPRVRDQPLRRCSNVACIQQRIYLYICENSPHTTLHSQRCYS